MWHDAALLCTGAQILRTRAPLTAAVNTYLACLCQAGGQRGMRGGVRGRTSPHAPCAAAQGRVPQRMADADEEARHALVAQAHLHHLPPVLVHTLGHGHGARSFVLSSLYALSCVLKLPLIAH